MYFYTSVLRAQLQCFGMYLFKQIFTVLNIYTSNTKIMPNYRYGKNYEIVCHTTDKIYIGSTPDTRYETS